MRSLEASRHNEDVASSLQSIAASIASITRTNSVPLQKEEVVHLLLAIQSNAHRIQDEAFRAVGLGLFPFTSMANHSCAPNCAHEFMVRQNKPPLLIMRALEDIPVGTELVYSYVPLYSSCEERQTQLSASYGFTCTCSRCSSPSEADMHLSDSKLDENGPVLKELRTCLSLMNNKDISIRRRVRDRLLKLLSSEEKMSGIHPLSRTLLSVYSALACQGSLSDDSLLAGEELRSGYAFGLLAVAISYFAIGRFLQETLIVLYDTAICLHRSHEEGDLAGNERCNRSNLVDVLLGVVHQGLSGVSFFNCQNELVVKALSVLASYICENVSDIGEGVSFKRYIIHFAIHEWACFNKKEAGVQDRYKHDDGDNSVEETRVKYLRSLLHTT